MCPGDPLAEARLTLGKQLAAHRRAGGYSQASFAPLTGYSRSTVATVEVGRQHAPRDFWERCDGVLGTGSALAAAHDQLERLARIRHADSARALRAARDAWSDETEALELARRVVASEVGHETLSRLELAVDDLCTAYPVTPPAALLLRVREHLGFVARLLDARKTLREHGRLLVVAGWLSLLAATLHIDLRQRSPAAARLTTAEELARHTGHAEIAAWTLETRAWSALTDGEQRRALELAQAAQRIAPRRSSALIQATAQEGRAWARLRRRRETVRTLDRLGRLVSALPTPDRPEHHYRYDPDKSVSYLATTLAWVRDPAAEDHAREVLRRLDETQRPRRVALARVDLALALMGSGKPEEACAAVGQAIASGRVVPSNHWRALEVVEMAEARGLPEAAEVREAYEVMRHAGAAAPSW